ncbi:MAG: hypothetical protein JSV31_08950 [Desulfobacterales bacterium]|nr:MAG: hypothetical protein JSV31_08950 [Desulfobacterales bacterium]
MIRDELQAFQNLAFLSKRQKRQKLRHQMAVPPQKQKSEKITKVSVLVFHRKLGGRPRSLF